MNSTNESNLDAHSLTNRSHSQRWIVALALAISAAGAVLLSIYGWQQSALFLIGGLLGITLYHASFGFASAYRNLVVHREVQGMVAQLVMLAIATILFAPVLASGTVFGQSVRGAISPVGVQGAIGALLFGIGMQLGGACGCGTLYTLGSGSLSMLVTLVTFCLGAFGASLTRQLWKGLPSIPPIVLGTSIGWVGAVALQLALFAVVAALLIAWGKKASQPKPSVASATTTDIQPDSDTDPLTAGLLLTIQSPPAASSRLTPLIPPPHALLRGPWSLLTGAIVLAVLNWLTLLLSGQPWRITWGFALWAATIAQFFGWDSTSSQFWGSASAQQSLQAGIAADVSSVMNIGIVLGAFLASALAGRLVFRKEFSWTSLAAALLGGSVMGYGAFLAAGCNVSAFFSGIASTSVHGWVWIGFALLGTAIGSRLRPLFQLPN